MFLCAHCVHWDSWACLRHVVQEFLPPANNNDTDQKTATKTSKNRTRNKTPQTKKIARVKNNSIATTTNTTTTAATSNTFPRIMGVHHVHDASSATGRWLHWTQVGGGCWVGVNFQMLEICRKNSHMFVFWGCVSKQRNTMDKHFFSSFFLFGFCWETWQLKVKPWRKWSPVAQAAAKAETELPKENNNGAILWVMELWMAKCCCCCCFFWFDGFFVTTKQFEGKLPLNGAMLLSYMWILPTMR